MALPEGVSCTACGLPATPGDVVCQRCGTALSAHVLPAPQPAVVRADDAPVDATRYMCAGAYLDERFAKQVVEELFGQTVRAVAPSYGFDIRPVAVHCLAAHRSRRRRDAFLALFGLAMLAFGALPTVVSGTFWAGFGWLVGALRDGPGGLRRAFRRITFGSTLLTFLTIVALFVLALVWTGLLVGVSSGIASGGGSPSGPGLLSGGPSPATVAAIVGALGLGILLGLGGWVVLYVTVLMDLVWRRLTVMGRLRRAAFVNRADRSILLFGQRKAKLDAISAGQYGNATVYSGFDPFVGAGRELEGWSFAIPLVAARGHVGAVERFSVDELVAHVRQRVAGIATTAAGPADDPLRGLVVGDRVFVHGLSAEGDGRFVPIRFAAPRTDLAEAQVEEIARDPHGAVRHYCTVRVESWRGEIVSSVFFHFSTDGEKLYCQWVPRVLGPVCLSYQVADFLPQALSLGAFLNLAAAAAAGTVRAVLGAPSRIFSDLRGGDRPSRDIVLDYGARLSVRQLAAEADPDFGKYGYHNYFQQLDVDKHHKIIEREALAAIVEFLDAHGIDTAELKNRQETILNDYSIKVVGSGNVLRNLATGPASQVVS